MRMMDFHNAPRLVIEGVRPSIDAGRHPIKRAVGDDVRVQATIYRDGHDLIRARLLYRPLEADRWRAVAMRYERDFDHCTGAFTVDGAGRWLYTVEAWTDRFGTWHQDMQKKVRAGVHTHADLLEGANLVEEAAGHAQGGAADTLNKLAALLRAEERPETGRARAVLDPAAARLVYAHLPPADLTRLPAALPLVVDPRDAAFAAWYEMFPRSQGTTQGRHGTFRDAMRRLPEIAALGFDVVYLPPIHPIGRTHRKGPNNALSAAPDDPGSPWAIGNENGGHTAIEPALGTADDFRAFVDKAAELGMQVALDYALQCSPDHPWVTEHPEWFFVRPDGSIRYAENPPKKYEDIYPLNFWGGNHRGLWEACRDIFLHWIDQGVRTFRVDNPHTKPFAFWEWVIAEVKGQHPDVVFLSEAFTRPARMRGLAKLGFTQSYTYFTWRNDAAGLRDYLTELTRTEMTEYFRPNFFVNTPDILHEYLQRGGRPAFRIRLILAATLAPVYGMYSGYELCENTPVREGSEEYLDSEKYQVRVRDWNAPGNIKPDIETVNRLRREHPALQQLADLEFRVSENDAILFFHKWAGHDHLLIAVNLDPHSVQETMVHAPLEALGHGAGDVFEVTDLLTGSRYEWRGRRNYVRLDPALQVAHILHVRPAES
jgi:starch synthase (maltosyl-transferring)